MTDPTYSTLPGSLGLPSVAPLYIDGIPISSLTDALASTSTVQASQREATTQHFFSTPTRPNGDTTRDVFEISLATTQRINRVQFQLAHFPQRAWVEYFDTTTSQWIVLTQDNGMNAEVSIQDSIPQVISSGVSDNTHIHPQHFGTGHWASYDFKIIPVAASRFRIVMFRLASENAPVTNFGDPVDYSLGIKDFNIGYLVASKADVPNLPRSSDVPTERTPIASSQDILGSAVDYVVRENRASDLLAGNGAIWKSGPQPLHEAVVNLYVDARNQHGAPQVIDSFFLDPLYSGGTVNLYYSLDTPNPVVFPASDIPLSFPRTRPYGATTPVPDSSGLLFPPTTSFLDIDNVAVQFDPTQPFQFHGMFQPQFPSSSATPATFYDDGVLSIGWGPDPSGQSPGVFYATMGSMIVTWTNLVFAFNTRFPFTLTFDGEKLILQSPDGEVQSITGQVFPGTNPPQTLRIGGSLTEDPDQSVPGNFRICSFMIKSGNPDDDAAMAAYWADPSAYVVTPEYPTPGPQTSDNALLRYDPSQQTPGIDSLNPYGFLGGPGVVYELLNWSPVARNYIVRKGYFDFDPLKARFFKLEFSSLAPEHYETDSPVVLTGKIFAAPQQDVTAPAKAAAQSPNNGGAGMATNVAVAAINRFADQAYLTTSGVNATTPTSSTTYLPTEAMRVLDPQAAVRMAQAAPYWNFKKFQSGMTMPRFNQVGQHYYETVSVPQTSRIAFFTGLNNIQMYRSNYQIADDRDRYLELFHDDQNITYDQQINNWALADGRISTSPFLPTPVTITSTPYGSFRTIMGIQFATTQSPPVQPLTDPDFDDESLQYWTPTGDATIVPDPFYDTDVGSLVRVTRGGDPVTWASMEISGSWDAIEDSDPNPYLPTWDSLENQTFLSATGGIESFETVQPSRVGKLCAATRVLAPATLTAPLTLRLVNGDGSVLAENPMNVIANQITEWFVEYDLGAGEVSGNATWDSVEGYGTWDDVEAVGTWSDVSDEISTISVYDVKVQLTQDAATSDVWYIDNLTIFNDAIMWEFSRDNGQTWWRVWDIRNNPNGVFLFPEGDELVPGNGSQLMWRVTGAAPDLSVSALQIRVWFDSLIYGVPYTRTVQQGGPNLSPLDQNPDVSDDPMFKQWSGPIPQDWYYIYRQFVRQNATPPAIRQPSFLPNTLPVGVDEGSPAAPSSSVLADALIRPL